MNWALPTIITSNITRADTDVEAFLSNSGASAATYRIPLTQLVQTLKGIGFWTLCSSIWPFVGGTSTTNSYDLKGGRTLTFHGTWTHSSTGSLPDGSTAYAQTGLTPSVSITLNDEHISYYSRTVAAGSSTASDIGSVVSSSQDFRIILRRSTNAFFSQINGNAANITGTVTDGSGWFLGSRTTSTAHSYYRNLTTLGTSSSSNTDTLPNIEMYIGASNFAGTPSFFTNKECAFATVGKGVSSAIASLAYTAIQNFQIALGRNV